MTNISGIMVIQGKGHITIKSGPYYGHDRLSYEVTAFDTSGSIGGSICLNVDELMERIKQAIMSLEAQDD